MDEFRIFGVKKYCIIVIENFGSYYYIIGEFKKVDVLIIYVNFEKKKFLEFNSSGMIIFCIIFVQVKFGIWDFEVVKIFFEEVLKIIEENLGIENYWKFVIFIILGFVYENLGDIEKVYIYYIRGNEVYKIIL